MKKLFFSAVAAVAIMFSACSSDDVANQDQQGTSGIRLAVDFEEVAGPATRAAASSTAIPITTWSNVEKIRMFLYNPTDGTIAYSYEIDPATKSDKVFNFLDIPSGTYDLALVANIRNSAKTNVATSVDNWGTIAELGDYTVRSKKLNTAVVMDLKKMTAFPTGHTVPAARLPYYSAPEVFMAYQAGVVIATGQTKDLTATPLLLKREVSMMRFRINKKADFLNEAGKVVDFAQATNLVAVQNIPVAFGVKVGSFAGGINAASDANRIIIGASGVSTFKTANPTATTHTNPVVIDADFTLWQDVLVLPNATKAEGKAASADATQARKFSIIVSAYAPAGYVLDNGTALATARPIYWSGIVNEVFLENNIREVNLTIKSRGTDVWPEIKEVGGLDIKVGAPENWNATIQRTDKEI